MTTPDPVTVTPHPDTKAEVTLSEPYDRAATEAALAEADTVRAENEAVLQRSREVSEREALREVDAATSPCRWCAGTAESVVLPILDRLTTDADRAGYERGRREALEEAAHVVHRLNAVRSVSSHDLDAACRRLRALAQETP